MQDSPLRINFKDFFGFPIKFLKLYSFDLSSGSLAGNQTEKFLLILKSFIPWIYMINATALSLSISLAMLEGNQFDILKSTFATINSITCLYIVIKLAHFHWYKNDICELVKSLSEFYPKVLNPIAEKYFFYTKILHKVSVAACIVCDVGTALIPVISYFGYGANVTIYPFPKSIFDPSKNVMTYLMVYLWQAFGLVEAVFLYFAPDIMIYTIISCLSLEWEELCCDFRELINL